MINDLCEIFLKKIKAAIRKDLCQLLFCFNA